MCVWRDGGSKAVLKYQANLPLSCCGGICSHGNPISANEMQRWHETTEWGFKMKKESLWPWRLESIISFCNFVTNILEYPDYNICYWIVFVHHVHLESAWNQNWPYWMIFSNDSSVHVILKKNNGLSSKYKYNNLLSFWNDFPFQSTSPNPFIFQCLIFTNQTIYI